MPLRWLSLISLCLPAVIAAEPGIAISQIAADGIYQAGDVITWTVKPHDFPAKPLPVITYQVQRDGAAVVAQGTLDAGSGSAVISCRLDEPSTLLATITATISTPGAVAADAVGTGVGSDKKSVIKVLAGAVVEPGKIQASAPKPADFDAFWMGKLAELASVPMNPVLEPLATDHPGLAYWHLTMDNIKGTHIQGQLARPAQEGKYPALLVVQWAGVYPLKREWALGPAREGWLTLNISAHDQPIDESEHFYQDLAAGELKNYAALGNDDRETSYFLRMFLACSRAVDYLAQRPDWDGRTLIATGTSQGGLQSFVAAGLNPKVTAIMVNVPAGCDNTCLLAGRAIGWPYWVPSVSDTRRMEASRYFDAVNFATRVTCPALISLGLLDVTARPTGILAAAQQLRGAKELVIMPAVGHQGDHAAFVARAAAWKAALKDGKPLPSR